MDHQHQRGAAAGATSSTLTNQNQRTSVPIASENKQEETEGAGGSPSSRPGNFFELLAAAVSASRQAAEHSGKPDFQEYLKISGVKMAWVRAIVALYEEPKKPDDPLAYILKLMGLEIPDTNEIKRMQDHARHLRGKLLQLQSENEELKAKIQEREEALGQDRYRHEIENLYFDSSRFKSNSDDDSDGDQEEEAQILGFDVSDSDYRRLGQPQSIIL